MKISVLILAKNEEDVIEECLKSVKDLADEIIVLDQNSTDKTATIAKKYTQKIFSTNESDFSKNRNLLASLAKGKWLMYLDSDELADNNLTSEVKRVIVKDKFSAFYIPRKNYILGKEVRNGGWWPDFAPRLIKKNELIGWEGEIHESPKVKGSFGYLKHPIIHYSARNLNFMLTKSIKWAKIEAELYFQSNNPKITILKVIKAATAEFFFRYFVKKGALDGVIGLIVAIYQSLHKAIIFTYLWELQNNSTNNFKLRNREL